MARKLVRRPINQKQQNYFRAYVTDLESHFALFKNNYQQISLSCAICETLECRFEYATVYTRYHARAAEVTERTTIKGSSLI